jgi:hypothetical protein
LDQVERVLLHSAQAQMAVIQHLARLHQPVAVVVVGEQDQVRPAQMVDQVVAADTEAA